MGQGLVAGGFALACAVGALWVGQPFRRSVLTALSVASLGSAVVSRLAVPHGPLWTVVAIAVAVLAVFGALALAALLVADGLLLIRSQGAATPQSAALAVGTGLAALAALTVLTVCCSGGHLLVVVCLVLDAPAAYLALLFVLFLGHTALSGRLRPRRSADYVVVLGAGLVDGEVSPLLASRLDRGLTAYGALLARGCRPTVITSGGRGPDEERSEAEAMAAYLVARGVPGDCVRREDRSRNTGENLANSARIMRHADPRYRCTVITSDFHAFRTALLMRRLGVRGSAAGAWTAPSYWLAAALREFVAVLKGDPPMPSSLSSTALAAGTAPHTPEAIEPAPSRQGAELFPELDLSDPRNTTGPDARAMSKVLFARLAELEEGTHEYQYARNTLIELNLTLVKFAARRFKTRSEPMEDIVQVGTIGLVKAIDRFDLDPTSGSEGCRRPASCRRRAPAGQVGPGGAVVVVAGRDQPAHMITHAHRVEGRHLARDPHTTSLRPPGASPVPPLCHGRTGRTGPRPPASASGRGLLDHRSGFAAVAQ